MNWKPIEEYINSKIRMPYCLFYCKIDGIPVVKDIRRYRDYEWTHFCIVTEPKC